MGVQAPQYPSRPFSVFMTIVCAAATVSSIRTTISRYEADSVVMAALFGMMTFSYARYALGIAERNPAQLGERSRKTLSRPIYVMLVICAFIVVGCGLWRFFSTSEKDGVWLACAGAFAIVYLSTVRTGRRASPEFAHSETCSEETEKRPSAEDRLKELDSLKEKGLITDDEYRAGRTRITDNV